MVRYVISLIVFFVGIISTMAMGGGGSINYFIDFPSLIIVGIFSFLFISVLFGFRELCSAFSEPFKKEADEGQLRNAMNFFKIYGHVTWMTSFIAVLISVVAMLGDISNESTWGPYVAVILISPLYGALINLAVIIPFTVFIKKRMKD